jgi:hypothetical protein
MKETFYAVKIRFTVTYKFRGLFVKSKRTAIAEEKRRGSLI